MFTLKLRLERYWEKYNIKRHARFSARQVAERSWIAITSSFFFKSAILMFFGALILFPFLLMILVSIGPDVELQDLTNSAGSGSIFTGESNFQNFAIAFQSGFWRAAFYSAIMVVLSIFLKLLITSSLGYAFSLHHWRGKKFLWWFFLSLLILPEIALLTGQLRVVNQLNLTVNIPRIVFTLVLPFAASTFNAFMFRASFELIPPSIKMVSKIDGASGMKYFFRVALPMVQPTIWTVVILTALSSWSSFLWPSVILTGSSLSAESTQNFADLNFIQVISQWVLTTGLIGNETGDGARVLFNLRIAAAFLAILPVFLFYFIFRRRIMNSVSRQGSSIKG